MNKLLILTVLPLTLAACSHCPNPQVCAKCEICNRPASLEAPLASAAKPVGLTGATNVYRIAPAKLFATAQEALTAAPLNLKIVSAENGVILTDWKEYEGEFHIARRWDDRTRYRVSIIPDVADPANASRFEVAEETQRRSNDRAAWQPADRHPERVAAVTQAINARLK